MIKLNKLDPKIASFGIVASLFFLTLISTLLHAETTYPNKPIKFIVPSTTGITSDTLARLLAPKISKSLNTPIIVDNKAGAGGIIGADTVAKSDPDGYNLLFANTSFATLAASNIKLPYDPIKSFAPISLLSSSVMTLVISNSLQISGLKEFIDYSKKNLGKVNYSSPGLGTTQHLAAELINQKIGTGLVHVPYKGSSGAITDLIAGHVQASVVALQTATPFIENGKIKLIAVLSKKRISQFSNTPTFTETGYEDINVSTWSGVLVAFGTPNSIVLKLNSEIERALALPDVRDALMSQGIMPVGGKPEVMEHFLKQEINMWSDVIRQGNIQLN